MPLPRFVAPQSEHRVGQVYLCCRAHASSFHVFWSYFRQPARRFRCDWLTYQARYVRVVLTRRAIHASYESPWHSLAKHHLLEACFLLMAPFRSMLLTLRGGSESLAPTAHWIPVYPMMFSTFLCRAFTAHEKQHVVRHQPTQRPDFGGEEVGRHEDVKMGAEELLPRGRLPPLRCWWESMALEDIPHSLVADGVAQVG